MTVDQAIRDAELVLPGEPVAEGTDPRWQAIIAVGGFIDTAPEPVWSFIRRWGRSPDADLRDAVATCLLEHLLEHLAKDISVPPRRINEIVHGTRAISADTALRLARYFGTSDRFWLDLQARYDLEVERDHLGAKLEKEVRVLERAS